jgi:hypothetical protein
MPLAGQRPDARMEAHVRWAERYARQRNMPKALAHFGRALDFGNTGKSYSVAIRVYVDRDEVEANNRSYDTTNGKVKKPFLFHATNGIENKESTKFLNLLVEKLESELTKAARCREGPTVRLEIYESGDMDKTAKPFDGHRWADRGVYIEMCPWHTAFAYTEEEEISKAIRRIVPKEMEGVLESDIRSIAAAQVREFKLIFRITDRAFAEGADSFIWKRCVSGVLNRYIEEQCGLRALVRVSISKGRSRKRALDGSNFPIIPIMIQVFVDDETTDEQIEELHEKIDYCLPGIRSILSRIYAVGPEADDKMEVGLASLPGKALDEIEGPWRPGGV